MALQSFVSGLSPLVDTAQPQRPVEDNRLAQRLSSSSPAPSSAIMRTPSSSSAALGASSAPSLSSSSLSSALLGRTPQTGAPRGRGGAVAVSGAAHEAAAAEVLGQLGTVYDNARTTGNVDGLAHVLERVSGVSISLLTLIYC